MGVPDRNAGGMATAAIWSCGDRSGSDRPTRGRRRTQPLRLGARDRVDRGAVPGERLISLAICARARVRHRAKDQLAGLDDRLDSGDSRRRVGSHG
jgi:hypothetical protein